MHTFASLSRLLCTVALAVPAVTPSAAHAQTKPWPTQTVRLVVPFGAGGPADVVARAVAQKLSQIWEQPIVIDNKPGGNTTIGGLDVVKAKPDGYTLFQAINSTLTVNRFTFSKQPYDIVKDFVPIALIATVSVVFVANEKVPATSVSEFIALAKAQPGKFTIGGGTVGLQLAAERFSRDAKISLQYVPYKSGVDVTRGVVAGEIDLAVDGVVANLPYIKTGKLRALATNGDHRVSTLPDVPTLAELGYLNSEAGLWHAFMGPAGLPKSIQAKIQNDLKRVLEMPDIKERFVGLGLEPTWAPAEQLAKMMESESAKLGPVIKDLGLKMD